MIDRARQVVLPDVTQFGQSPPFPPISVIIWAKGVVQVLGTFIFDNDYEDDLQLVTFENLDAESGAVRLLLSRTTADPVSRNIRSLVAPFIQYIKSHEPGKEVWRTVCEWLLDHAATGELDYVANAAADLPDDIDRLRFLHTCLTACYLCHQSSPSIRPNLYRIQDHLSQSLQYMNAAAEPISLPHPETDLLPSQLCEFSPLAVLNTLALKFLDQMIMSAEIIAQYSFELSLRELVTIREGAEEVQRQLIDRLLQSGNRKTRNEAQWRKLRQSLKWLQIDSLVLGKVSGDALDSSILSALLDSSSMCHITTSNVEAFGLARKIYVRQSLLPSNIVEKTILDAFYRFYDNATNGNRTRGGMKMHFKRTPCTTLI
jgi:protein transport protein SEC39